MFIIDLFIPGAFALWSLNLHRKYGVPWADCFLKAFTIAVKVWALQMAIVVVCMIFYFGLGGK